MTRPAMSVMAVVVGAVVAVVIVGVFSFVGRCGGGRITVRHREAHWLPLRSTRRWTAGFPSVP
ncbi:hypothetical protein SANTM175S_03860 [Streptomyces antimycoticus]